MTLTSADMRRAVREMGLSGAPLVVHSSLRSFGYVDGGAHTVIGALMDEGCTLLVPAFSDAYETPPPPDMRPARNACDYEEAVGKPANNLVYSPDSLEIELRDMGAIPAAVVAISGRARGNHPLCSFAAVGPLAQSLVSVQMPLDVNAPLRALADREGFVVLMGVDLRRMTLLHLAEQAAGRALFRRWANDTNGKPMMVEVGGCSNGFCHLEPIVRPLMRETLVGESLWKVFPAGEALEFAAAAIRMNPEITHCEYPGCERCNDSIAGGPIIDL